MQVLCACMRRGNAQGTTRGLVIEGRQNIHPPSVHMCVTVCYPVHTQGVKQSVYLSVVVVVVVVVVGMKITRSRVLGIYASYEQNKSIDIGGKLVCMCFELLKKAY